MTAAFASTRRHEFDNFSKPALIDGAFEGTDFDTKLYTYPIALHSFGTKIATLSLPSDGAASRMPSQIPGNDSLVLTCGFAQTNVYIPIYKPP